MKKSIKTKIKLLIVVLTTTILTYSCKEEKIANEQIPGVNDIASVKGDGYEMEYKYAPGVVIVNQSNIHEIERVENDSIIYVSQDSELAKELRQGSIISSEASEKLPYGLGNKVDEITQIGNLLRCVTSVAPLDEIFEDLKIDATVPMIREMPSTVIDDSGNTFQINKIDLEDVMDDSEGKNTETNKTRGQYGSPEALAITLWWNTGGNGGFVSGTLYLGCLATFSVDIKAKKFEISMEPTAGFSVRTGIKGSLEAKINDKSLFKKTFSQGYAKWVRSP